MPTTAMFRKLIEFTLKFKYFPTKHLLHEFQARSINAEQYHRRLQLYRTNEIVNDFKLMIEFQFRNARRSRIKRKGNNVSYVLLGEGSVLFAVPPAVLVSNLPAVLASNLLLLRLAHVLQLNSNVIILTNCPFDRIVKSSQPGLKYALSYFLVL